jgi:hypothetical protein
MSDVRDPTARALFVASAMRAPRWQRTGEPSERKASGAHGGDPTMTSLSIGRPVAIASDDSVTLSVLGGLSLKPPCNVIGSVAVSDRESGRPFAAPRKAAANGDGSELVRDICAPLNALDPKSTILWRDVTT